MNTPQVREISPQELQTLLSEGKVLLIDVREPDEYAAERIPGALLYPLSTFDAKALPPDESRQVVFQCGSGVRSMKAAKARLGAGAARAAHLTGGLRAWSAAGFGTVHLDPATGAVTR